MTPRTTAVDADAAQLTATIGQTIREWREARGLTQQELADRLGVTKQAVSNIERADTSGTGFTLATIVRYADALNLTCRIQLLPRK